MRHGDCHPDYPSDPELTTAGRQRVRSQLSWLGSYQVDVVICSDKRRAMQTVEELRNLFPAAPHEVHPQLREIHPRALSDGQHEDAVRAANAFEQLVEPRLRLPSLLVAHQNILSYFCRRIGIQQDFREFCACVIV